MTANTRAATSGGGPRDDILAEIERQRFQLNLSLLTVYNYYRAFIGFALLAAFSQTLFDTSLGSLAAPLFWWTGITYTLFNLGTAIALQLMPARWFERQRITFGLITIDILALVTMMFASGGITSGVAALLLVTVATGAILLTGRSATLVAALATIALLYEEFYLSFAFPTVDGDYFQGGVYGGLYFAASLAIQRLSTRIRNNDVLALTQAAELADLERLNRQIVQRMLTGIIVVDGQNAIRMHNQSALSLIGSSSDKSFLELPDGLLARLNRWRADTTLRAEPFKIADHTPEIRVNFSAVRSTEPMGDVTIFIEDTSEVQQQAQQLKLAELGRLSASIAHEVRNPLGAISHAAQLLAESDALDAPDKRLSDIIISHCQRMNGVVENVLEMSRRRNPQPERSTLRDLVIDFVDQARDAFPQARVELAIDPPGTIVRVDPAHLNQVLTNLIDNALRYSNEAGNGERARIEGGVERNSDRPFLNVIDFGTGVDDEQIPTLFQPFVTNAEGGTGLGLYIAKELCDANQAHLSYSRHADGGSCFRILFTHPDRIIS